MIDWPNRIILFAAVLGIVVMFAYGWRGGDK